MKKWIPIALCVSSMTLTAAAARSSPGSGLAQLPPKGSAIVWSLGHCGYAVRTADHFLIFDYQEQRDGPMAKSRPGRLPDARSGRRGDVSRISEGLPVAVSGLARSRPDEDGTEVHLRRRTDREMTPGGPLRIDELRSRMNVREENLR